MIKVSLNIHPLKDGHKTRGIGQYTANLIEQLKKRPDIILQEFTNINEVHYADIVHYPWFDLFRPTLPFLKKFPTIVTIHDVTPLVFPQHYPPGLKGQLMFIKQKYSLKNVKAIITDSNASKKDIHKYLSFPLSKIYPIYLAPGEKFKTITDQGVLRKVKEKYSLPDIFALYIGSVNWNKNLLNIAQAAIISNTPLVLIGADFKNKDHLNHPELSSYKEFLDKYSNHPLVKVLDFIEINDLVPIINSAFVTLLPSFYEGFGLTILESQACGTPVITSKVSSMPEVAGNGAILVDPLNITEIKNALLSLKDDQVMAKKIIQKGFENVKKFSWSKTASETIELYKSLK